MTRPSRSALRPLIVAACLSACRDGPAPEVELFGATAVVERDGVRVYRFLGDARPRLRVEGPADVEIRWGSGAEAHIERSTPRGTGVLIEVARPNEPDKGPETELEVSRRGSAWTARVQFDPPLQEDARIQRIAELARSDPKAARVALDTLSDDLWPWACVEWARAVPVAGRVDAYLDCAEGAGARGFVSEIAARRIAALYWARQLLQLDRARSIEASARRATERLRDARLEAVLSFQKASLALERSDLREAQRSLATAVELAEHAGADGEATMYRMFHAGVLSELGRHHSALTLIDRLASAPTDELSPRDATSLLANAGWVRLRASFSLEDPALLLLARRDLEGALSRYLSLELPEEGANVAASLARLELLAGDEAAAKRALEQARALNPATKALEKPFLDLLEGELESASGHLARARAAFQRVIARSAADSSSLRSDYVWRAELGLAEVALAENKEAAARRALARARDVLARTARRTGATDGRVRFLDDRRRLYVMAVDSMLSADDAEAAFRIADEAAALLYRTFERDRGVRLARLSAADREKWIERESAYLGKRARFFAARPPELATKEELRVWQRDRREQGRSLATESINLDEALDALDERPVPGRFELATLAPDEALLELFPGSDGADAFWVTRGGVVHEKVDDEDFLHPSQVTGIEHLYVVPGGWPGAQNLPRMELGGRPLIEHVSISFIPYADWLTTELSEPTRRGLVVADPRRNLPHAYDEGRAVAKLLEADLLVREEATLSRVLSELDGRRIFHFSGHGRLEGEAPWDARLELATGQVLDFETLMVKRPLVGIVVLSGCDTGRTTAAPSDGVGLAEAFLSTGARAVLATTATVGDADARRFIERFYRFDGADRPAKAFRAAALESMKKRDPSWRAFRVVGRR